MRSDILEFLASDSVSFSGLFFGWRLISVGDIIVIIIEGLLLGRLVTRRNTDPPVSDLLLIEVVPVDDLFFFGLLSSEGFSGESFGSKKLLEVIKLAFLLFLELFIFVIGF